MRWAVAAVVAVTAADMVVAALVGQWEVAVVAVALGAVVTWLVLAWGRAVRAERWRWSCVPRVRSAEEWRSNVLRASEKWADVAGAVSLTDWQEAARRARGR